MTFRTRPSGIIGLMCQYLWQEVFQGHISRSIRNSPEYGMGTGYPVGPEAVIDSEIPHVHAKSDAIAQSIPSGADLLI